MTSRRIGLVAVVYGVLLGALALLPPGSWPLALPFVFSQALGLIAVVLVLALQYALWVLSAGRPGRALLLAAFVLAVMANLAVLLVLVPMPFPTAILQSAFMFIASLLLAAGLVRGRLIPSWIPPCWVGAASVSLVATAWRVALSFTPPNATLQFWQHAIGLLSTGLAVVFWVALGVALIRTDVAGHAEHALPADNTPRSR